MDCNPPGSSVIGIFQARILEWVAISFSRVSSRPRDWTRVSCTAGRFFTDWATREAQSVCLSMLMQMQGFILFYDWVIFHYVYHIFFFYSSIDRNLGCFHILAIVNYAAVNLGIHISFHNSFSVCLFSLEKCPKVELLGHMVVLWDWNESWPFPVLWPLLSFQILRAYWVQHFHSIIFQDLK